MDTLGKSAKEIEAQKWETAKSQGGMKPDQIERFPMMLYRAAKRAEGKVTVDEGRSQRVVHSEAELKDAVKAGWHESPQDALDAFEDDEQALGSAAAERAAADRKMSKKAQTEAAKVENKSAEHLGEIPEGRKPRQ